MTDREKKILELISELEFEKVEEEDEYGYVDITYRATIDFNEEGEELKWVSLIFYEEDYVAFQHWYIRNIIKEKYPT